MRAALVGAGHIARQHLSCLARLDGVDLVAVCDRSRVAAEAAAERHGASQWFTDHRRMLAETRPDVVHVTTPVASHVQLVTDALEADSHVFVEKPLAASYAGVGDLIDLARRRGRWLIEDLNYLFNEPLLRLKELRDSGRLGTIVHVEVDLCLAIAGRDSAFADPHLPHPALSLPGGAIGDLLPHVAALAIEFAGPAAATLSAEWGKRDWDSALSPDEFRGLVLGTGATAALSVTANAAPESFTVRVHGTHGRAHAGIFEPRLVVERVRDVPRPLNSLLNGIAETAVLARATVSSPVRRLRGGPGTYEGVWELIRRTYDALAREGDPPIDLGRLDAVHRLSEELVSGKSAD